MDKFNFLVDSSFNLLEASKKNEESVTKSVRNLGKGINLLNESARTIDRKVEFSVQRSSEEYAKIISEEVISKLDKANKSAEKAAKKYESAAKFSILKLGFMFFLFFLMAGTLLWIFFIKEIPSISEMNNLREEKILLEKNIYQLKQYGDLTICGDKRKPCIKVDISTEYSKDKIPYYAIVPKK
jgi:hypothetical protein